MEARHLHTSHSDWLVERLCYLFAKINIVFVTLLAAASVYYMKTEIYAPTSNIDEGIYGVLRIGFTIAIVTFVVVAIVFAVILNRGICKKKPSYLKAYFTYELVVEILLTFFIFVAIFMHERNIEFDWFSISAIVFIVFYWFAVILVYRAYLALLRTQDPASNEQSQLVLMNGA